MRALLIERGANVNAASRRFQFGELKSASGGALMERAEGGMTPLHYAAREGSVETGEVLIAGGAHVGQAVARPHVKRRDGLGVARPAQLVLDRPSGTRRLYELNPAGIDALRDYFDKFWNHALAAFKKAAEARASREGA